MLGENHIQDITGRQYVLIFFFFLFLHENIKTVMRSQQLNLLQDLLIHYQYEYHIYIKPQREISMFKKILYYCIYWTP